MNEWTNVIKPIPTYQPLIIPSIGPLQRHLLPIVILFTPLLRSPITHRRRTRSLIILGILLRRPTTIVRKIHPQRSEIRFQVASYGHCCHYVGLVFGSF